nr:uncharacterized protein LOC109169177 [Ipomoea batatas]
MEDAFSSNSNQHTPRHPNLLPRHLLHNRRRPPHSSAASQGFHAAATTLPPPCHPPSQPLQAPYTHRTPPLSAALRYRRPSAASPTAAVHLRPPFHSIGVTLPPRSHMPPRRTNRAATPPPEPHMTHRRASPRSSSSSLAKPSSRRSDSDDPVEHFDESVGDSVAVHNTSHRVFRAFSFVFYCSSLNFLLETFTAKNFIHQRRLDVDSFSSHTDLVDTLKTAKLFKTVTKVEHFVRDVVFEFYTNLVPELTNARLAYVRGRFYEFSPRVINAYYGLPGYADYFDKDLHEITKRLAGGHASYWISKDSITASEFTSFFVFLHKIAYSNWMPTTNHRYVTKKMAALLFKIDTGVSFDLGQLLFDQIVDARNGKAGKKDLVLPNLIYGLLSMQGFQKHSSEYFKAHPVPIKFNPRLLSGSHFDDLGLSRDAVAAGPSSSANSGELAIEFLENELCLISAQRKDLVNRELQVRSLLLKLKGFGTIGSVDRLPVDNNAASESTGFSSDESPNS